MQLRGQLHHRLVCMLPAPCEPALKKSCQLRDLVLLPLVARLRDFVPTQLGGFIVTQRLCQKVDENRLVLGAGIVRDHEAKCRMKGRRST